MASHAGAEVLCCADKRPHHETVMAFFIQCERIATPCIKTDFVKDTFYGSIIYDQYFCAYAISQRRDEYYTKGFRRIRYYVHCHCRSPGSLQCQAATAVLIESLKETGLKIFDESCIPVPRVCCDTWNCVPLRFMGGMRTNHDEHVYFFLLGSIVDPARLIWPIGSTWESFKIHDSLNMVALSCTCNRDDRCCVRRVCENFNIMRMFICCSYDRSEYDGGRNCVLFRDVYGGSA